jgi:peptidoglycan hydrolase CwlO-like protein
MNRERLARWARRGAVVVATAAVLAIGVSTVQVAAEWRRAAAPLDTAPVGLETIGNDYSAETERAAGLSDQIDDLAGQVEDLKDALSVADGSMAEDQAQAEALQAKLDGSMARLVVLQRQLKAAQARLVALNRAAARQAALNQQAGAQGTSSRATTPTGGGDDEEEDDD